MGSCTELIRNVIQLARINAEVKRSGSGLRKQITKCYTNQVSSDFHGEKKYRPCSCTHTLDAQSSQSYVCLPPAVAAIPSPHSWSMSTTSPHKDLQGTRMQPGHFMSERQAQVPSLSHVTQRKNKMCCFSFYAFGFRDGPNT